MMNLAGGPDNLVFNPLAQARCYRQGRIIVIRSSTRNRSPDIKL